MSTSRWRSLSAGRKSASVSARISSCSQPENSSSRAREYAVSARVAGSFRPSSRRVLTGWMVQARPSRRATVSTGACLRPEACVARRGGDQRAAPSPKADERRRELENSAEPGSCTRRAPHSRRRVSSAVPRARCVGAAAAEPGDRVGKQPRLHDRLDLGLGPRAVGRRGGGGQHESAESDSGEATHRVSIGSSRLLLEARKRCQRRV